MHHVMLNKSCHYYCCYFVLVTIIVIIILVKFLSSLQVRLLKRGLELLEVGGRIVYSTCSLNPVEDEAVLTTVLTQMMGMCCSLFYSNYLYKGMKCSYICLFCQTVFLSTRLLS